MKWSEEMGASTTRMWAELQALERSKFNLRDDLTDIEKELRARIDSNVTLSQRQAEIIDALIHQKETLEHEVKALREWQKKADEALFGTDSGKLGLVVESRVQSRVVSVCKWVLATLVPAVAGAIGYLVSEGWLRPR